MRWSHTQKHLESLLAAGVTLLALLALAGCYGGAPTPVAAGTLQTTATTTTAQQPTATETLQAPTVDLPAVCHNMHAGPYAQVGDLITSQVSTTFAAYGVQIPQGTPNQPLKLSSDGQIANLSPTAAPIGVDSYGYYSFTVCNPTAQAVAVESVWVRVASFTPYSGALAAWEACNNGFYDANQQIYVSGGCGYGSAGDYAGAYAANEYLEVSLPAQAEIGDSAMDQAISSARTGPGDPNPFPRLPLPLAPGHVLVIAATVTAPVAPGTYTFGFGLVYGYALAPDAPQYFATTSPILYAPVTQEWGGKNCLTPAIQTQIPVTSQTTEYICPPAS